MKLKLTILALVLFVTQGYAQSNNNTISVMYAPGNGDINIHGAIGDFGYEKQNASMFGFGFSHHIKSFLSLETGVNFSTTDVKKISFYPPTTTTRYDKIKLITIPALVKLDFLKYLYVDLGALLDFQTNYTTASIAPNQSGIGIGGDLGAKYSYKAIMVFVSPYFQYHDLIKFSQKGSNFELLNTGVKLGVGYSF